jgi:hypothetical protein
LFPCFPSTLVPTCSSRSPVLPFSRSPVLPISILPFSRSPVSSNPFPLSPFSLTWFPFHFTDPPYPARYLPDVPPLFILRKFTNYSVLSRHLRPQPLLAGSCSLYPQTFTTLTSHNIHTPLVERGVLYVYFKASKQSSGHFTSMYALSQEMFKLGLERGGEKCVRLWKAFKERPAQRTVDALMRGYNID